MNQKVKRAIAAAMSLTMVATATPVSPLYNAIQNAVSSVMMQASAVNLDNLAWNKGKNSEVRWAVNKGTLYIRNSSIPDNFWADNGNNIGSVSSLIILNGDVLEIGNNAFEGCLCLKSVSIPENVYNIKENAFKNCSALESASILCDEVTIGSSAFEGCSNLTSVLFKCYPTINGTNVFQGVGAETKAKFLYLEDDATCNQWSDLFSTNYSSEDDAVNFQGGRFADIPYSIIKDAEDKDTNLMWYLEDEGTDGKKFTVELIDKSITDETLNAMPNIYNDANQAPWWGKPESITSVEIGEGVTSICHDAFFGLESSCTNLLSVTIPDSVKTIGMGAFIFCESLESITIPASVESIGCEAFSYCTSIASVTFEGDVPEIEGAFSEVGTTDKPVTLYYPKGNASWETLLNGKDEVFKWEDGWFKAEAYIPLNKIEGTNLQWSIDEGKLTIDRIDKKITDENENSIPPCAANNTLWAGLNFTSLKIEDGITSIGTNAFYGSSNLESIIIPDSVTSIGGMAFQECKGLKSIMFKGNYPEIGMHTFYDITTENPVKLYYPNGNDTWIGIGEGYNYYSWNAAYMAIPYSIIKDAEDKDTNLMWYLEDEGTDGQKFTVELIDKSITDETLNAMPVIYNDANHAPWWEKSESITSVEIGEGVTSISGLAFWGIESPCTNLLSVTIPDSVKTIGIFAFADCTSIASVTFEGDVPEIEDAFSGVGTTDKPVTLYYPKGNASWETFLTDNEEKIDENGVLNWDDGYFKPEAYAPWNKIEGTNLQWAIDEGKLTIDLVEENGTGNAMPDWNYRGDVPWDNQRDSITSVEIKEGVTSIGFAAFGSCSSLTSITIPDSVTSIGNSAFAECSSLTNITIPDSVTEIGTDVFWDCTNLSSITAPCTLSGEDDWKGSATVTYNHPRKEGDTKCACGAREFKPCGEGAYYVFDEETGKLTITGTGAIGEDVFSAYSEGNSEFGLLVDYDKIKSVEIGKDITEIGGYAFYGCSNLESVTFAKGSKLEYIDDFAFVECTSLTSITIPDSVTYIGQYAFTDCNNLENVTFAKGSKLEDIESQAFEGCTSLTSITIPDSVTYIGECAFYRCSSLNTIIFEGKVPEMENFNWYDGGNEVHRFSGVGTPENPVKLVYYILNDDWYDYLYTNAANIDDNGVFNWEGGYFKPEVDLSIPYINITGTNLRCKVNSEGTLIIDRIVESATTGNAIPECRDEEGQINEENVPWSEADFIKSVEIADGVTHIGSASFYTDYFESVAISESVTGIGDMAFLGCSYLTSVTFAENSKLETIGNEAFEATGLTEIKIPDGVTSIGDIAFYGCPSLTSVTFAENSKLETIGMGAFEATGLTEIKIPDGVTSIGDTAFLVGPSLTSVTFAENSKLKTIGMQAFATTGLTEIKIPDGVTSIGNGAFSNCTSLESITFEGNVPDMGDEYDVFANVGTPQNPVMLYYPKGNTTWETFLETAKSEGQIDANGVLSWGGGYFTVESCVIWKNITDTDLRWAIDEGALCIDKQENPSSDNFDVPAFSDDAPWKNYVNQINRVVISKDVEGVDDTSFAGFEGKILVLENGYNGTMPDDINNSTYSSFGGGEFIYKTQLVGGSLSLDGQIGVNLSFYVNKDEGSTITINGETVDLSECEHEGDIYTYTLWVAPRDAYKDITFKTEKDSDTIVDQTYNVKDEYVDVVLEDKEHKTYSEDVYNMVSSLNLFINSSRIYFNEVEATEAAAIKNSITSALKNLDLSGLNKSFVKDEVDEAVYYGSSLILDSGVKLRHYITIADEDNVANIKIKVGDDEFGSDKLEKASFTSNSHDVYYFETDEFNPEDFGTNVSVIYEDTAAASGAKKVIDNYSVLTFISLSLGNPETAAKELGTTCRSIYNYYLAADNYNKN